MGDLYFDKSETCARQCVTPHVINDPVNHPPHYTSNPSGVECIDVTRHMGFNLGNAMKYIWRADLKGQDIQDLEKAVWYLKDEIAKRKEQTK
jgi:hypothetical protein